MDNPPHPFGAMITRGPSEWQIIQRDAAGLGALEMAGRWVSANGPGVVQARLVHEATGAPVSAALDWQTLGTRRGGAAGSGYPDLSPICA